MGYFLLDVICPYCDCYQLEGFDLLDQGGGMQHIADNAKGVKCQDCKRCFLVEPPKLSDIKTSTRKIVGEEEGIQLARAEIDTFSPEQHIPITYAAIIENAAAEAIKTNHADAFGKRMAAYTFLRCLTRALREQKAPEKMLFMLQELQGMEIF